MVRPDRSPPTRIAVVPPVRERRHALPLPPTPLLGREGDIAAVVAHLDQQPVRLLTLTGPPGVGKTRLALALADRLGDAFPDGVSFVDLAPISDPSLVAAAIAQTLGVRERDRRGLVESLRDFLTSMQRLLVLDNFEQVIPAAPLIAELLAHCPALTVLVTSRAPLHVRGEQEFPVPPLGLPDRRRLPAPDALVTYPAIALFLQRARDVRPDFALTADTAPVVAEICAQLDGLPLAIELAAARVKVLPPPALLARLTRRLQLLTGGARDLPPRLRSLRSAIDWSYDLLTPNEQLLLRRLAVFVGGCTLEAAAAVCNAGGDLGVDILDTVASLIDQSLLLQTEAVDSEPRLRLLEMIREFGLDQLTANDELVSLRQRHAAYFLALAEAAVPGLLSAAFPEWLQRLDRDHDNLRAALQFLLERDDETAALRLAAALAWFWHRRGFFSEGRRWLAAALALPDAAAAPARVQALFGAGRLAFGASEYGAMRALMEETATLAGRLGDRQTEGRALGHIGWAALLQGDIATVRAVGAEALPLLRAAGDTWGTADCLAVLANAAWATGEVEAESRAEECLAVSRETGDPWLVANALMLLGRIALRAADIAVARRRFEDALMLRRQLSDPFMVAHSLAALGVAAARGGDTEQALASLIEGLGLFREVHNLQGVALCLTECAGLAAAQGQPERAARLFGAAEALREEIGAGLVFTDQGDYERTVAALGTALGADHFAAAWATGRTLPLDAAIIEACRTPAPRRPQGPAAVRWPADRPHPVPRAPAYPDGLSAREVEVMRLVAAGQTNQAIADALVISLNTVTRHLTHIFAKTGSANRAEAAAYATRRGLVN